MAWSAYNDPGSLTGVYVMAKSSTTPATNDELARLLTGAAKDATVSAIISLLPGEKSVLIPAEDVEQRVQSIMRDAATATNLRDSGHQVFKNLGAFAVAGPPDYIRFLTQHPDVASAMPNERGEDMLIRPVKNKRVK